MSMFNTLKISILEPEGQDRPESHETSRIGGRLINPT